MGWGTRAVHERLFVQGGGLRTSGARRGVGRRGVTRGARDHAGGRGGEEEDQEKGAFGAEQKEQRARKFSKLRANTRKGKKKKPRGRDLKFSPTEEPPWEGWAVKSRPGVVGSKVDKFVGFDGWFGKSRRGKHCV